MKNYLVIYSLNQAENLYTNLISYLKSSGYWAKPFAGVWIVRTTSSASEIRDGIKARINPSDKVFVVAMHTNEWGTFNVSKEVTDWMHKNHP